MQEYDEHLLMIILTTNRILLTTTWTTKTTFMGDKLVAIGSSAAIKKVVQVVIVVVKIKNAFVVMIITLWNFIQLDSERKKPCIVSNYFVPLQCRRKERILKLWHDQTFQW